MRREEGMLNEGIKCNEIERIRTRTHTQKEKEKKMHKSAKTKEKINKKNERLYQASSSLEKKCEKILVNINTPLSV